VRTWLNRRTHELCVARNKVFESKQDQSSDLEHVKNFETNKGVTFGSDKSPRCAGLMCEMNMSPVAGMQDSCQLPTGQLPPKNLDTKF